MLMRYRPSTDASVWYSCGEGHDGRDARHRESAASESEFHSNWRSYSSRLKFQLILSGNGQNSFIQCGFPQLTLTRFGPNFVIDPSDDFTRVATDTIAYCSMSHRLNSFYTEQQPEFAVAMSDFLKECGQRFARCRRRPLNIRLI